MQCFMCSWAGGKHDPACPDAGLADANKKKNQYFNGYRAGKAGKDCACEDPSYHLGWTHGDIEADKLANGEYA